MLNVSPDHDDVQPNIFLGGHSQSVIIQQTAVWQTHTCPSLTNEADVVMQPVECTAALLWLTWQLSFSPYTSGKGSTLKLASEASSYIYTHMGIHTYVHSFIHTLNMCIRTYVPSNEQALAQDFRLTRTLKKHYLREYRSLHFGPQAKAIVTCISCGCLCILSPSKAKFKLIQ